MANSSKFFKVKNLKFLKKVWTKIIYKNRPTRELKLTENGSVLDEINDH